jgi:hypothetical protein
MTGLTVSEMAEKLNLPTATVKKRLLRAGCKPFSQEALYAEKNLEKIRNVAPVGRPSKQPAEAPKKHRKS